MEQNGTEQNGTEWNRSEQNGTDQNRMEWNRSEQNVTEWNGTAVVMTKQTECVLDSIQLGYEQLIGFSFAFCFLLVH